MEDLNENEVMTVVTLHNVGVNLEYVKYLRLVLRDFYAKEVQEPLPRPGKLPAFNLF